MRLGRDAKKNKGQDAFAWYLWRITNEGTRCRASALLCWLKHLLGAKLVMHTLEVTKRRRT
jgi:hypothetical protein